MDVFLTKVRLGEQTAYLCNDTFQKKNKHVYERVKHTAHADRNTLAFVTKHISHKTLKYVNHQHNPHTHSLYLNYVHY